MPVSQESQTASVLTSLRLQIEAGASEFNAILSGIATAAQTLTDASGAAIALGPDKDVVCIARSGEIAPELGTRLSTSSGLSGVCMRSQKTLRCDDTQMDQRVDSEVCLRLGLRSIVAVPIRGELGSVGLLEVFSVYPFAFSDAHIQFLENLAHLVERAHVRQLRVDAITHPGPGLASFEPEVENTAPAPEYTAVERLRDFLTSEKRPPRRLAWVAAATVGLLLGLGWTAWRTSAHGTENEQETPIAQAQPAVAETAPSVTLEFSPKPSPAQTTVRDIKVRPRAAKRAPAAAEDDSEEVVVHDLTAEPRNSGPSTGTVTEAADRSPVAAPAAASAPPQIADLRSRDVDLQGLLPTPDNPKLIAAVSQGVTRGALVRKVQPAYPAQARILRLAGAVALEATIGESGTIEDVRVLSGHPVLARAAVDAVKQWRYAPSLLNGQPVKVKTAITVNFAP